MNLDVFDIKGRRAVRRARRRYEAERIKWLWAEIQRRSPRPTECPICVEMYDAKRGHACL